MFLQNTKLLRTLPQGSQNPGTQTSEKAGHVVLSSELPTTGAHQPMMLADPLQIAYQPIIPTLATFIASVHIRESIREVLPRCDQISPHVRHICPCLVERSCQTNLRSNLDVLHAIPESCRGNSLEHCRTRLSLFMGPAAALKHNEGSPSQAWSRNCCLWHRPSQ